MFSVAQNKVSIWWTQRRWQYLFVELTEFSATEELAKLQYLSDTDRVRYRCIFVRRHQASPATQKLSAPVTAEGNSDVSPLVTNKMYRGFTVLHRITHTKNISVQNTAPSPQPKSQMANDVSAFSMFVSVMWSTGMRRHQFKYFLRSVSSDSRHLSVYWNSANACWTLNTYFNVLLTVRLGNM